MSTPAVSYLRVSTDRQETSIAGQRAEVQKYAAKNGFRIVRECVDEGVGGGDTDLTGREP
jgi:DNA invertase Pin-like site-specific DNA recombinase